MKKLFLLASALLAAGFSFSQKAVHFTRLSETGDPVIFLPHIGCSSIMWREVANHYQQDYAVYLADFAGFNGMPPVKAPYTGAYVEDIQQFIRNNKLNNVLLIGQNYGAFVAFTVAQDTGLNIKAIIASDFYPKLSMILDPGISPETLEQMKGSIRKGTSELSMEAFASAQKRTAEMMNFIKAEDVDRFVDWQVKSDRITLAETLCEQFSTDLLPELKNNKIPVLAFSTWYFAEKYRGMPVTEADKKLKEMYGDIPNVTHRITTDAKDFMANDQPHWFVHEMDNFLKNLFGK